MKVGVGSPAARVMHMKPPTSQLSPARVAKPAAMQAAGTLLRGEDDTARGVLNGIELVGRFVKCASSRPTSTVRVVAKRGLTVARSAIFRDDDIIISSSSSSSGSSEALNASAWGLYTTVEELRSEYGTGRNLGAAETRDLYHSLLPTKLLEDEDAATLPERAHVAIAARRAARLYARERALLPLTMGSELMDGVRTLKSGGRFQPGGMSEAQIWQKYAGCVPSEGDQLEEDVYYTIISKACTSNHVVDDLCVGGLAGVAGAASVAAQFAASTASDVISELRGDISLDFGI